VAWVCLCFVVGYQGTGPKSKKGCPALQRDVANVTDVADVADVSDAARCSAMWPMSPRPPLYC